MASSDDKHPLFWSNDEYEIRPAKNIDEFYELWWDFMQIEGWNRGYYDLDSIVNPSRGSGMILLIEKKSGRPVGHVGAVINENSTGWVTMFIIAEAHRGKGLGAELFRAAMKDFENHDTQVVGLDAVVQQKPTYERRKFVSTPAGSIRIMIRPLAAKEPVTKPSTPDGLHLVNIRDVPRKLLAEDEKNRTGFDRPKQWSDEHMFNRKDVGGVALVSARDVQSVEQLKGWGVTRRCSGGIRIGPVYAADRASAKAVLVALMESGTPEAIEEVSLPKEMTGWSRDKIVEEATLVTEAHGPDPEAVKLFEELGWKYAGVEYFRMWVDGKSTPQQTADAVAGQGVWAIFDAAVG